MYTPATYAKAIVAFLTAGFGALAATHVGNPGDLDLGQWIIVFGTGLTAGGAVFATPNRSADPGEVAVQKVEKAAKSVREAGPDDRVKAAVEELAVTVGVGTVKAGGTLLDELLNHVRKNG